VSVRFPISLTAICPECRTALRQVDGLLVHDSFVGDCPYSGKKFGRPTIDLEEVE